MYSSPAIGADGTVYVGSDDDKVYALDGATGAKKWEFETGGGVYSSPAIGADGTVYVGSDDNKVYALDGATGPRSGSSRPVTGHSSPAIGADGTVYVGSADRKVYALEGASPWPIRLAHAREQCSAHWVVSACATHRSGATSQRRRRHRG